MIYLSMNIIIGHKEQVSLSGEGAYRGCLKRDNKHNRVNPLQQQCNW